MAALTVRLARLIERDVRGGVHAHVSLDVGDEQEGHHERATQRDRAAHRRRVGEVARDLAVEVQVLELHRRGDALGVRRPADSYLSALGGLLGIPTGYAYKAYQLRRVRLGARRGCRIRQLNAYLYKV